MKILILTGHFFPEIHPRAFRAAELANEFARRDHDVTVALLRTIAHHSYEQYTQRYNVKFQKLNIYKQVGGSRIFSNNYRFHLQAVLYKVYRYLLEYFMDGSLFINAKRIAKRISIRNDVDYVISLSTPFMNHMAISYYRKASAHSNTIFVADSGDPFYRSQQTRRAPYFFYIEKKTYEAFDYLAVPATKAIPAYLGMIAPSKLKVIPQGFNLSCIKLEKYAPSQIVKFAYCGVFYDDIRNPQFLLEYLVKIDSIFCFHVFLRHEDPVITNLLAPYLAELKGKMKIYYGVNREDLLSRLSSMDFLINIDNLTTTQVPSKLIDYAIVKRPILSFNADTFSSQKFDRFLVHDYTDSLVIDVSPYDIKNVAAQFIELAKFENI